MMDITKGTCDVCFLRRKKKWQFLLAVLLCFEMQIGSAAFPNPFRDPNICGHPQCEKPFKKFGYTNNIYKYDYSIDLSTEFFGAGDNTSNLFLKASLDLFFPKPCEGYLRITEVELWDHQVTSKSDDSSINDESSQKQNSNEDDYYGEFSESNNVIEGNNDFTNLHPKSLELAADLKRYLLRFAFHDGLISEICPNAKEPVWTLNFKKGVLSALQNTMKRFDVDFNTTETDVSGNCNVKYSLENVNDVFIMIRKVKNIATCRNRYSTNSILQTTPYTFRDDKTIWPILDSESFCDMTIINNFYHEISCYERHQLIPFSNSTAGAITRSISRLVLHGEGTYSNGEFLAEHDEIIEKRSSLLFDHKPSLKPTHSEIKLARDLLKEMCSLGFPNIQREFINAFINFLHNVKYLDYEALTQLLARSTSICDKGKNHVLESLPYIGSTASYQLMRDQLLTNAVSKAVALNWLKSLSFIQYPDEDTLETFYTIIEFSRGKAEPEYLLSASAVIHSYCRRNTDCGQNMHVRWITDSLETEFINLFNAYRGERRLRERMIVILKAIGNVGVFSEQFVVQLQKIIVDDLAPTIFRLESIFVFRRIKCMKYRSMFLGIFENFTINSEIRIASYLQSMMCPDYQSIDAIKKILKAEEVNQCGSFVWSHLKNLARSSSPSNIAVQSLLLDDDLSTKFKLDIRKFSRNYLHDIFFDEYNFGTTTDMNLIFGTESYLPRMATLNLTAHLFGHSVNFFELSTRAEGFEQLITSILSSADIFNQENLFNREGLLKTLSFLNYWFGKTKLNNHFEDFHFNRSDEGNTTKETRFENNAFKDDEYEYKKHRPTRSLTTTKLKDHKVALQKDVEDLGYKLKYDYNNPRIQFGVRVFGNELHYYSLDGLAEILALVKELNIFHQASKILSGKEVKYSKTKVLLDASYNAPLAVGLPLSIHALAASAIDVRISGKLEHMELVSSDWNFNVKGMLKPSILIDVITTMQSDFFYAQSGVKVKCNLYSNSEVEVKLKVRGKNLVSFSFNLPQNTSQILSAQSELLVIKLPEDQPQTGVTSRKANSSCTWSLFDTIIGLKMCVDFSVPDLSNSSQLIYPALLLSGPLNFNILLMKSDPTAQKWLFEYIWEQQANTSDWSLVFLTPESALERSILANVSTAAEGLNMSVLFINGPNKVSARCQYIANIDYRRFEFLLDTNGNRSLDLNMELRRLQDRNVWVYQPKMLLAVNGVNITGAVGTIRINEKNGVVQSDVDFSFETRKLQMLVRGIIVQSEVTKSANITVNYRFQADKIETINFEARLLNTGDKSKIEYEGNMKLKTSAHPKLNCASNVTWLTLQGHTEGVLTFNNAQDFLDPAYTSMSRLILARSYSEDRVGEGSRTHASFDIKIPRSKIDFRLFLKHEERSKDGSEHNVLLGVRFKPEKEASCLVSILFPRSNMLAFDAYVNISIPEFNSCSGRLKVIEKNLKIYMITLNGSWFTDHSIAIKANYKDRNSRLQALKMIVESPSFETTAINAAYGRNQILLFSRLEVKYGSDPYGLITQFNLQPDIIKDSICEIHLYIKEKVYWLNASVITKQPLMLQVEIHLDKLRDVYIKSSVLLLDAQKELLLELKWDVNRDPSQQLRLLAEYRKPSNMEYNGVILVTYPERTITCRFNAHIEGSKYFGDLYSSWGINEVVIIKYNVGIMPGKNIHNWIQAEVNTLFDGWRRNSFNAGVFNFGTLFLANTSLLWAENQNLDLSYKCDFNIEDIPSSFEIRFGLNSSFEEIPSINVNIKHWHDLKKVDTDVGLRYGDKNDTLNIYGWKSIWDISQSQHFRNISGTVMVLSPHKGFRKGGLAAKFSLSDKRKIFGAASLTFDLREITLAVNGYVNKFTDNMLTINITTPLSNLRNINARFGLIEERRHVVAEIQTPTTALGIEALFDIKSLSDFDVKLSAATPIENFNRAALFAKLKSDTVDMRVKWNNITGGFIGVYYMNDLTDFEYSYRIFTPLKDFEENGFIVKFKKRDIFALLLHCRLSSYSFGIRINGQPNSMILKQLGNNIIELKTMDDDDDFSPPKLEDSEYNNVDDIEYDEFLSYFVEVELDLLICPTIEGAVDIQEVLDYYFIVANIKLPQGQIDFKDRLYFPDYLNVINVMRIYTPFAISKDMKVIVEYHIDINFEQFNGKMRLIANSVRNVNPSVDVGFQINYIQVVDAIKPREHYLELNLRLPFSMLTEIGIAGRLELDDGLLRGNITSIAGETYLSLATALEAEESFLEASVGISLKTDIIPHYVCTAYFKKDYSKVDNSFNIRLEVIDKGIINKFQAESTWQSENVNNVVTANGKILTTMLPLKTIEYSVLVDKFPNLRLNLDLGFSTQNGLRMDYGIRAIKRDEVLNLEMWTPLQNYKNLSLHGTISAMNSNQYRLKGIFYRDMATYTLNGNINMHGGYPISTTVQLQPRTGDHNGLIEVIISRSRDATNDFSFELNAKEDGKNVQISGNYTYNAQTGYNFSMVLLSTEATVARIGIKSKLQHLGKDRTISELSFETPWTNMGLEQINFWSDVTIRPEQGKVQGGCLFNNYTIHGGWRWLWKLEEDMQLLIESHIERPNVNKSSTFAELKYLNLGKSYKHMYVGGKLNLSSEWNLGFDGTYNYQSNDDIQIGIVTYLPAPIDDVHEFKGRYRGNLINQLGRNLNISAEGEYSAVKSKKRYLTCLTYENVTNLYYMGHIEWGVTGNASALDADLQVLRKDKMRREFTAKLSTPQYPNEATFVLSGYYDQLKDNYHYIRCSADYPASRRVTDMDFAFQSFTNLYGYINCTTPFLRTSWLRTVFNISTSVGNTYRYCRGDWPTNFSFFKMRNIYTYEKYNKTLEGNIELEVPLTTRHRADMNYRLKEEQNLGIGEIKLVYNEKLVLNGIYRRWEDNHTVYKETTQISLENDFKPLGIHYINTYDWAHKSNSLKIKHIEIFDLNNSKSFNLTTELYTIRKGSGKEIKLVAIHPNRTIRFTTNFEERHNHIINNRGKLELSKGAWIGYNIKIKNNTVNSNDTRSFMVELSYPKRRLSTYGWYYITTNKFHSNVSFEWSGNVTNSDKRVIHTSLLWQAESLDKDDRDNQTLIFILGHSLLEKDITLRASFYRGIKDLIKANILIDYSNNLDYLIKIDTVLSDLRHQLGYTNYEFQFLACHKASELDVQLNCSTTARSSYFKTESKALYRNDYFPEKRGLFLALFDLYSKEIEYVRISPYRTVRVWIRPSMNYPIYGLNATVWDTPDTNNTGYIYVDLSKKQAHMNFNLTEDGSHNLHMLGFIPDSRSSYFNIWRNYEEMNIIDVTSFIKMNHSRHISGRFYWRPNIKNELKQKINTVKEAVFKSFSDSIDFWMKTLYTETLTAAGVVWDTTREYNKDFINDISQISVLEEDLDDLRIFLNKSYEADDFYIKTVVNFTLTIIDEAALRDHIDSLPVIFSEIRQAMGESGKALRKSIINLIEMIKIAYNNLIEATNRFFQGQSLKYITDFMERGFEKYEKFIKEIHISFINHVEDMWNKFCHIMSNYVKGFLKRLEPHIFETISVVEKTAWDLSKEIFDYIYKRTNELAESTYFNKVSSFTQDVDGLYKDIKSHDALRNIKKYAIIIWKFVKDKYFKLIPFGAELNEVLSEIWLEVKELQKIQQFQIAIQKYNEVIAKLEWLVEEFKIKIHMHQLYALIRNKLRNYGMNAIEVSAMYREAKTKFVFDPEEGIIDFEQKLPLSWHAFNETPQFKEIAEYRFLTQIQNVFTISNSSLFGQIYHLRSYLDPKTWLPPHYARAFLIDSRYYITFDRRFVSHNFDVQGHSNCTYLLAHDFWQRNFTLLLEISTNNNMVRASKFILIANGKILEIDLHSDTFTVNGKLNPMLPVKLDDVVIQSDSHILSIYSDAGFKMDCNIQFDLCWFEVSGWYFGQTAGLLGTMNNEPFDDLTMPSNVIATSNDMKTFTDAWSTKHSKINRIYQFVEKPEPVKNQQITETCNLLFTSLSPCGGMIDPGPFYDICIELGDRPYPNHGEHPALEGPCSAALTYIEICQLAKIPLRVPQQCLFCQLINGSYVQESTFVEYENNNMPHASDIVFIVEAKSCNTNLTGNKNIMNIATTLEDQLQALNMTNNRYAVVAFGAQSPPFDYPRCVTNGNDVFVNTADGLRQYFAHVMSFLNATTAPNANNDILQAISIASKLNFRPGASKTFILLPCSSCELKHMRFDYSSILQYMLEEGVVLHILADTDFDYGRSRKLRHFFGFDKEFVFSNRFPEGDSETRHQIYISKSNLGICTQLALEAGGTVFSIKKLPPERKYSFKRFATVFAKRVARSAVPIVNQTCECTGYNTGVAYMACASSIVHNPKSDFDEDEFSEWSWYNEDYDNPP